ncbi:MAG: hypothetical protein V1881_03875 [Candidatus Micrarchaeota archaeon]
MKAFWWFLIALVAAGAWYYGFGGAAQLDKYAAESDEMKQSAFVTAFSDENAGRFVTFTDPDYGFAVKYPIGFAADYNITDGPRLSARAVMDDNLFEIIEANVQDVPLPHFGQTMASQGITLSNMRNTTISGKEAVLFDASGTEPVSGEAYYGKWAFLDCATPAGKRYTLGVTAAVSASLTSDLRMIDYVIYSVKC